MKLFKSAQQLVAKILLGIIFAVLVISFALWGVGDLLSGRVSGGVVAKVGSTEILQGEFLRTYFSQQVPQGQVRGMRQANQALSLLVDSEVLAQEAKRLGLKVGDQELREEVEKFPAFQDFKGEFDALRLEGFLQNSGYTRSEFSERFALDLNAQRIQGAVLSGALMPRSLAEQLVTYDQTKRSAEYLRVTRESQEQPEEPSEETLADYYAGVKDSYRTQELRKVTWLWLAPDRFADEAIITEDELQARYEELKDTQFSVAEQRAFHQEVLASEEEAKARLAELLEKEEAKPKAAIDTTALQESIVSQFSGQQNVTITPVYDNLLSGERLGPYAAEGLQADVAAALFAEGQALGLVSEIVKSPFGWHVLEVAEIKAGSVTPFEEVRETLESSMREAIAAERSVGEANRLDELLGRGDSLEDIAAAVALQAETQAFSRFGQDADGAALEGLTRERRFLEAVFASETALDETSLLFEGREVGGYYAWRLDEVIPAADRPLEEVRDSLIERWQNEKQGESARTLAEEILEKAEGGASLAELAEDYALEVTLSDPLVRRAAWPFFSFAEELFQLGDGAFAVTELEQDFVVLTPVSTELPDYEAREIREQVLRDEVDLRIAVVGEVFEQYMQALRSAHEAITYDEQVAHIVENGSEFYGGY